MVRNMSVAMCDYKSLRFPTKSFFEERSQHYPSSVDVYIGGPVFGKHLIVDGLISIVSFQ